MGSDSIAPLIRNFNTRWRWGITLTPREKTQGIHWKWCWVSPRYGLEALHKKLLSCSSQEANFLTFSGNTRHYNFVSRYVIIVSFILNFRKGTVQHPVVFSLLKGMFIYDLISILNNRFLKHRINPAVLGSYDRASWAKYEERRPTRCNN